MYRKILKYWWFAIIHNHSNINCHYYKQILDMKLIRFVPIMHESGVRPCTTLSVKPICNDIKMVSLGYWHEHFRGTIHESTIENTISIDTKCSSFIVSVAKIKISGSAHLSLIWIILIQNYPKLINLLIENSAVWNRNLK